MSYKSLRIILEIQLSQSKFLDELLIVILIYSNKWINLYWSITENPVKIGYNFVKYYCSYKINIDSINNRS